MSITTRLTTLLGIEHPIVLAPMDLVSDGRLAAAVSRAGGLGLIGGGYGEESWLRTEMSAAGDARVGVGFITWSLAKQPKLLDVALQHKPLAVMLSFGDPAPFAARIKDAGAYLICQVQSVDLAKQALDAGADILIAQGAEAGGHGVSRGTFALVPAIADVAAGVPVIAAGGVADGRGLAAALMLGGDGVLVGTRFYATQEAAGFAQAKEMITHASGDRTVRGILFDIARRNVWPAPFTGRVLRNEFSERWRGREAELMQSHSETDHYAEARRAGDFTTAAIIAGECVDLIDDIPPAAEIVRRIAADAEALLAGSNRFNTARRA